MYEYTDAKLNRLVRVIRRRINSLKTMNFDELNVIESVTEVFEVIEKQAKRCFEDILEYYYLFALEGEESKEGKSIRDNLKAGKDKKIEKIVDGLLEEILNEYDPVTKYQYTPELERKKQRLIEAVLASKQTTEIPRARARKTKKAASSAAKEIDKALRYLVLQVSEYAVKATDRAVLEGYRDAGVKYVRWVAQEDAKVCVTCHRYDGQIFEISAVPNKPHYNCRCYLETVRS